MINLNEKLTNHILTLEEFSSNDINSILDLADLLKKLERNRSKEENKSIISEKENMQLSFFQLDDPTLIQIKDEITDIDINTLTPVEALMKLNEIKKLIGK